MIVNNETVYTKDVANKRIKVVREFTASVELVWRAWTESELLDQWWAPKPWKANTISMDFKDGGTWLYYMEGPDGTKQYCRANYSSIIGHKSYEALDAFTDEKGNINTEFPRMRWKISFDEIDSVTKVIVEISFDSENDLERIVQMGFKEGFAMAHNNLDELLAKQVH